jgi:hypothetical protein
MIARFLTVAYASVIGTLNAYEMRKRTIQFSSMTPDTKQIRITPPEFTKRSLDHGRSQHAHILDHDFTKENEMLDKTLVAKAARQLQNPTERTRERDRMLFASMAAESLKLSGMDTSMEDVLSAISNTR